MVDLVAPVFVEPTRPQRNYYLNTDTTSATVVTDQISNGKINKAVQDDFNWSIETDKYERE